MPAMSFTVEAKTKEELKKKVQKRIRDASNKGMSFVKEGYKENNVKRIKGGYKIDIYVHS